MERPTSNDSAAIQLEAIKNKVIDDDSCLSGLLHAYNKMK